MCFARSITSLSLGRERRLVAFCLELPEANDFGETQGLQPQLPSDAKGDSRLVRQRRFDPMSEENERTDEARQLAHIEEEFVANEPNSDVEEANDLPRF